jgi:zinc transporter ZupT
MLSASVSMCIEGSQLSIPSTTFGVIVGIIFIAFVFIWAAARHDSNSDNDNDNDCDCDSDCDCHSTYGELNVSDLHGADAARAFLIVSIMILHSAAEGIGIGVSFAGPGGERLGFYIAWTIALHNIPEGLACALVLIPRGSSLSSASLWSIVTSLPQPLVAIPAFLFVTYFEPFLPIGLGVAAGAMLYMTKEELIPDACEYLDRVRAYTIVITSFCLMTLFQEFVVKETLLFEHQD